MGNNDVRRTAPRGNGGLRSTRGSGPHGKVKNKAGGDRIAIRTGNPNIFVQCSKAIRASVGNQNPPSYELLPFLRDVPSSEKQNLFIRKLNLCSVVFDFTDPTKNIEKDIKRQTLLELVDYITTSNGKFTEPVMQKITKMVAANLFRTLPPSSRENRTLPPSSRENRVLESDDPEEAESAMEPAWSHLQIVYKFLLGFVASSETDAKAAKTYIDHSFVLRLLDLFDSENPEERKYLKKIMHTIYKKFRVHRPFIQKAINNIFYRFIFETERHNGIAELLEILGSIIEGFALPLEEHELSLVRALIPLHKPKCVSMYHKKLSCCITKFVKKDFKLADTVIRDLLKYWPITNSQKEVMFLGELKEILKATQAAEFQRCMVPLFRQIGRCLNSSHFQVALEALSFWKNAHIVSLIAENCHVILPIIFPSLERNRKNHWDEYVRSRTSKVRKIFLKMDQDLFQDCQNKSREDEERDKTLQEKRELTWKRLENVAAAKAVSN